MTSGDTPEATEEENGEDVEATPSEDETLPEDDLAASLLLTEDDFPAGWTELPFVDEEENPETAEAFADCGFGEQRAPGLVGRAETGDFVEDGGDGPPTIEHRVGVFEDEEAVAAALAVLPEQLDCFVAVLEGGAIDTPEASVVAASFEQIDFIELGDRTDAYRIELEFELTTEETEVDSAVAYFDVVFTSVGRIASQIQVFDVLFPFGEDELQALAEAAADKLAQAE
ncbi:MAG: hypothetical protein WEB00_00110 [Dehalococcoidia bacterium]